VALKFQYNKTSLQALDKQLKVRLNALPTLQAKESALRLEVKKAREAVQKIIVEYEAKMTEIKKSARLWGEFPSGIISVGTIKLSAKKTAGVKVPVIDSVQYNVARFSLFANRPWVVSGLEILKKAANLRIERQVLEKKTTLLEYARKKTTQKVNLYEKVQIPEYRESILKIKRFIEDEENLAKSSQKILKERMARAEAAS